MKPKQTGYVLAAILLAFVLARMIFIHPSFSDETVYFNMAKQLLNDLVPYKDFFFAHPPLQLYVLAFIFRIFGSSFWIAKTFSLLSASLSVFLTYQISKKLYKGNDKKSAFLSAIFLVVTPAFIAFSTMGHGMWETLLLVLLSIYTLLDERYYIASALFAFAVFFRYIALLYFPFMILFLYVRKIKFKRFALFTSISVIILFALCLSLFGQNYIYQTISYHLFSKTSLQAPDYQKMQYWGMGFFSLFLALLAGSVGYKENDRTLLVLAFTALAADIILLVGLKLIFYHYFIISLPFYSIAAGRVLTISKDRIIKIMIPIVLVLSIVSNFQTIEFYLNPTYAGRFHQIAEIVNTQSLENEAVFGEPVITNYVSFMTGRKIAGNYFDSYMRHLIFEGTSEVVEKIKADQPRFLIDMENYYMSDQNFRALFNDYSLQKEYLGVPKYFVYRK